MVHIIWQPHRKSDRSRSEEVRKRKYINTVTRHSHVSRHHRLFPRSYHTNFENDHHTKFLLQSSHIELKADFQLGARQSLVLKKISPNTIQNCNIIRLFVPDTDGLENAVFFVFKRFMRISKYVTYASVVMTYKLSSGNFLRTTFRYLSRAAEKFTVEHRDKNTNNYVTSLKAKAIANPPTIELVKNILRYIPKFAEVSLADFPCHRLSNLKEIKLGNGQFDVDFYNFWDCVGAINTLEVLVLEVFHADDYFGNFTKCAAALSNLKKLRRLTLNLYDANDDSNWFDLLQKLQTIEYLCRKKDFKLNIKITLPKKLLNTLPYRPRGERVPNNICQFFSDPCDNGVMISLDFRSDSSGNAENIVFTYQPQAGKIKLSSLHIQIEDYLPFHQKALCFYGTEITQLEYFGYVAHTEHFDNAMQVHSFRRLETLNFSITGSNYKQFKVSTGGTKVLKELRYLSLSFAPEISNRVNIEHESLPIAQIIQILDEGKGLREFKLNFIAHLVDLDGVELLMKMIFNFSDFQKFTLRIAWKQGYLKEKTKETLRSFLTVSHPVQIVDFGIEYSSRSEFHPKRNVESEIGYFKGLLKQDRFHEELNDPVPTAVTIIYIKLC